MSSMSLPYTWSRKLVIYILFILFPLCVYSLFAGAGLRQFLEGWHPADQRRRPGLLRHLPEWHGDPQASAHAAAALLHPLPGHYQENLAPRPSVHPRHRIHGHHPDGDKAL